MGIADKHETPQFRAENRTQAVSNTKLMQSVATAFIFQDVT
jgi:hypothetical protein